MQQNGQNGGRNEDHTETRKILARAMAEAGIARAVNERDGQLTRNSRVVLDRRYLRKDDDGQVIEEPGDMFRRVAHNLSGAELNYNASEAERQETEDMFYGAMTRLEFIPNSPTLMNAGRELQQLSACFVLPVEDSLESIFESTKQTALIHKSGGGTGFSFSRLRPEGDRVGTTGGVASGPVSFIRVFDSATDVVKQGGTRRGANMAILDVTHPDILRFINEKRNPTRLTNFNVSVAVDQGFMEKVRKGGEYELVNPRTGKVTGTLEAREVFRQIIDCAWETGDPGLVFMDRINDGNPNPQLGAIESTNPCGEQPLLPYESCNLGSINLARMLTYTEDSVEIDWDRLQETCQVAVRMLDNVIDVNEFPIPQIGEMSRKTRRIGVGVMGWADMLIQLGIRYDSSEAFDLGRKVMKFIQNQTHRYSAELATWRGVYPAWEGSRYDPPGDSGFEAVQMRNSAPVTIAPTGTISIIAGTSSGIEPLFALSYERNVMDETRLIEVNPHLEAVARHAGFYSDALMEEVARSGTLQGTDTPQWAKEIFRTSRDISPTDHVHMQAAFQAHTDNSVSKTINLPAEATREDVEDAYLTAHKTGCKGITIYRDGSKQDQVLSTQSSREAEGTITPAAHPHPHPAPRPRPRVMHGVTVLARTGHGNMYTTINNDQDGYPFELFTQVGKAGGCDSAMLEAISRLISMGLRAGLEPSEITGQLRGITCCPAWDEGVLIRSIPDGVAYALSQHIGENRAQVDGQDRTDNGSMRCPECNAPAVFTEGCESCSDQSCGWNKCD